MPLGKAGYHIPRSISSALSNSSTTETDPVPPGSGRHPAHGSRARAVSSAPLNLLRGRKRQRNHTHNSTNGNNSNATTAGTTANGKRPSPKPTVFRIGRPVIPAVDDRQPGTGGDQYGEPERPVHLVTPTTTPPSRD